MWKIWKYSLGSFSDEKTQQYDNYVAVVRSVIFVSYMVTNCFIVAGVIRHWDKGERVRLVEDTALKAAGCKNFAGSIPVLSVEDNL